MVEIKELTERYIKLVSCEQEIENAYYIMEDCYAKGGKLIIAGNGGSASDAQHIVGELMKSFKEKRPIPQELKDMLIELDEETGQIMAEKLEMPLQALSLTSNEALSTAYINDVGAECVFAQQLLGYGKQGDVFLGISTSGNSKNVIAAAIIAKAIGMKVICLTGRDGGNIVRYSDVAVVVPEEETYKIQELHLPIYHWWCASLEKHFFEVKEK